MRDIRNNVSPRFIKLCTGRQQGVPLRSTKYGRRNQRIETSVVEFSYRCVNSSLEELMKIKVNYSFWVKECLDNKISKNRNVFKPHNRFRDSHLNAASRKSRKFNHPLWQTEEHFRTENFYKLRCLAAVLTHESRIAKELLVSLNFDVVIWKPKNVKTP